MPYTVVNPTRRDFPAHQRAGRDGRLRVGVARGAPGRIMAWLSPGARPRIAIG